MEVNDAVGGLLAAGAVTATDWLVEVDPPRLSVTVKVTG